MGNELCSTTEGYISVEDVSWPRGAMTTKYGFKPRFDKNNRHKTQRGQLEYLLPEGYLLEKVCHGNYVIWTSNDKTEIAFTYRTDSDYAQPYTDLTFIEPSKRRAFTDAHTKRREGDEDDQPRNTSTALESFKDALNYYSSTVVASNNLQRFQASVDNAHEAMRTAWHAMSDEERASNELPGKAILTRDQIW